MRRGPVLDQRNRQLNRIYTKPRLEQIFAYRKTVFADMFGNRLGAHSEPTEQPDITIDQETEPCA